MKLATRKTPYSRDGELCLVNKRLTHYLPVTDIAENMQIAVENWSTVFEPLQKRYEQLNQEQSTDAKPIDFSELASPFPRAFQWADGSAYVNHVELVRKAN